MSALTVISVLAMAILVIAVARVILRRDERITTVVVSGKTIDVDEYGFLLNRTDWSEEFARETARLDNCELTPAHWEVINFMREYYEEYQIAPAVRVLTKAIGKKLGPEKGNRKYLYELFPAGGPAKQAHRYAGLPRPCGVP